MAGRWRDGIQSGLRSAQPAATAVAIGTLYFVTDEGELERSDGATWTQVAINETGHASIDHTGLPGVGGAGTTFTGNPIHIPPPGFLPSGTNGENTADRGRLWSVIIAGEMLVRAMMFDVSVAGAGSMEWGLFDCSSAPTACTKVAGGSGALASTGWQSIAATGAPVTVAPGAYFVIVKYPASNVPTLRRGLANGSPGFQKVATSYVWDDTPDITAITFKAGEILNAVLVGDIDASNQW